MRQIKRLLPRKTSRLTDAVFRDLVRTAYRTIPYYQRTWTRSGLKLAEISSVKDIHRLPLVTKDDLLARGHSDRLHQGKSAKRQVYRVTSGMTGANFIIFMSKLELAFRQFSLVYRMWHDAGYPYPMTLVQAGSWFPLESKISLNSRRMPIGRVIHISRRQPIAEQIRALDVANPTVLTGCPSMLEILVRALQQTPGVTIRPKLVVTRGEVLRPFTRTLLSKTFACPVTNYYSTEEIGLIAWQCPSTPSVMHVNRDTCLLEILDEGEGACAPGQEGDVVVTNLFNHTMPLLRYVLGDRSVLLPEAPSTCHCRPALQSIRAPFGRSEDFIQLSDGTRVSPRILDDLVHDASAAQGMDHPFFQSVRDYQVIQESPTNLRILYLTDHALPDFVSDQFQLGLRAVHPNLRCEVQSVSALIPEKSGKRKRIISHLGAVCSPTIGTGENQSACLDAE